ncbi:keratin-associated protein 10-9-like isoform 2 [Planoprotostelium fungivorum]|uniref:Keratin-associated protein 10-9-like isoform 2 n=1 Tax=Planoprotostelium fungivorum TaxID=1890364 RepID=A0A2P6NAB8_9EUKA|nr:keratin-associated protein 10-9-like isoform 2 [Planoprotostelium fungivorum]
MRTTLFTILLSTLLVAQAQTKCGGFAGLACPANQFCLTASMPGMADEFGVCVETDVTCGGFAGKQCPTGFTCYTPEPNRDGTNHADEMGFCIMTQPILVKKPELSCPEKPLRCPSCPETHECKRFARTATNCSYAACVPKRREPVICPQHVPTCPACVHGQTCKVTPQTRTKCAEAKCVPVSSVEMFGCVMCTADIPSCQNCQAGQKCTITPRTCKQCASVKCSSF